jgi:two-component system, cell cycle response regulator DivK
LRRTEPESDAERARAIKRTTGSTEIQFGPVQFGPSSMPTLRQSTLDRAAARARILIVEDNPLNRLLIHDLLELRGHEILEASTVDEARQVLDEARPDLLVLDVQIPGGGAEAIIRDVRTRSELAELPIVAVTSLAMPGDRERLLGSGFHGYLSKPIDTRTFGAVVESFLKGAKTEDRHRVRRIG